MKNKVVKNAMTHGHAFSTKTWRVQNHGPARALTYAKNLKIHKHKNIMDLYCKWNVFWFSIIIVFFLVWYRHAWVLAKSAPFNSTDPCIQLIGKHSLEFCASVMYIDTVYSLRTVSHLAILIVLNGLRNFKI